MGHSREARDAGRGAGAFVSVGGGGGSCFLLLLLLVAEEVDDLDAIA